MIIIRTNCRILKERYLDGLLAIAGTGDFDCMGHVDLIKRYAAGQGVSIRLEEDEKRRSGSCSGF